jgi:hypothetical protein
MREKLIERWPGIPIPTLPPKRIIDRQLVKLGLKSKMTIIDKF